jgi:molybdenum cofactor cytidylyltransferase
MTKIPHILLAAGTSKRMGQPKQLLKWADKLLIQHQVETILSTTDKLYVVLGAYAERIAPQLEQYDIELFRFDGWDKGMGNSLAFAVQQLLKVHSSVEGVLISLIDQPLVKGTHFQKMRAVFESGKKQIIASESDSAWVGVPVLYDAYYLDQIQSLNGEEGAKVILKKYRKYVYTIPAGKTLVDMDTPEAYQKLYKAFSPQ